MSAQKGFTLVELLVVIAIIAILSTIGFAVYTKVQADARNAKRRADVDAIFKAFEQHYTIGTTTPYDIPNADWFKDRAIPQDPNGTSYFWNGPASCASTPNPPPTTAQSTYTICAKLEGSSGNGNSSDCGSSSGGTFIAANGIAAIAYCARSPR